MIKLSFVRYAVLGLLVAVPGCLVDGSSQPQGLSSENEDRGSERAEGSDGDFDRDDCKVEDDDLGRTGVLVSLNGVEIDFLEWFTKDGEPGEYIGFAIEVNVEGGIPYKVKAGLDAFYSDGEVWMHPHGTGGSTVSGISHVDFCDGIPGDGEPGDGEPGDGEPGDGEPGDGDPGDGDPGDGVCFSDEDCDALEICGTDNKCRPAIIIG